MTHTLTTLRTSSRHARRLRAAGILAVVVAAADLVTKWLAEQRLDEPVSLVAGLRLELGHNSGIAFGALTDLPAGVLIAGVSLVIGGLLVTVWRDWLPVPWPAVGLLVGGAVGNLLDRLGDGRVTDFIDPPRWPAFNVADIAITVAVGVLLWRGASAEAEPRSKAEAR
jgi:signal peptidase II